MRPQTWCFVRQCPERGRSSEVAIGISAFVGIASVIRRGVWLLFLAGRMSLAVESAKSKREQ